ncbi:MAG: ferredoxin [Candidatus Nanoarchaeia archaeon]
MAKYKIIYDRNGCIGAASCAAASKNWVMAEDGKADLVSAEISEEELQENIDAAQSCPVQVIHIENTETGERLI